jgi:hypothetical protein
LLESAYEACLEHDLMLRGLRFERQKPLPVRDESVTLECGYQPFRPSVFLLNFL